MMRATDPDVKSDPDLQLILNSASKCLQSADSIKTDDYLCIMHELKKLLFLFHPGLAVVFKSNRSGLKSLEIHRVSGARCYYDNLATMIQYETDNNLLKGTSRLTSGSVALQDLNHILDFVIQFLLSLQQSQLANKSFSIKQRIGVYMKSLGIHHSLLMRMSCRMALSQCCGRQGLLRKLQSLCHSSSSPTVLLNELLETLHSVHSAVNDILLTTSRI